MAQTGKKKHTCGMHQKTHIGRPAKNQKCKSLNSFFAEIKAGHKLLNQYGYRGYLNCKRGSRCQQIGGRDASAKLAVPQQPTEGHGHEHTRTRKAKRQNCHRRINRQRHGARGHCSGTHIEFTRPRICKRCSPKFTRNTTSPSAIQKFLRRRSRRASVDRERSLASIEASYAATSSLIALSIFFLQNSSSNQFNPHRCSHE